MKKLLRHWQQPYSAFLFWLLAAGCDLAICGLVLFRAVRDL